MSFEMSDDGRGHFVTMLYFLVGGEDPEKVVTICDMVPEEGEDYRYGICLYCETGTVVAKDEENGLCPACKKTTVVSADVLMKPTIKRQ